ncbi:MAG: hypothetical protein WBP59_03760 [Ilumatobacteraceae bacterium]
MRRSSASKVGTTDGIVEDLGERPPWEIVETFPSTDQGLIDRWQHRVDTARTPAARVRALVGSALTMYWMAQEGLSTDASAVAASRQELVEEAITLARSVGAPDPIAEALLGSLYATWGPDHRARRGPILNELETLRPALTDEELRLRILEWLVLDRLDHADIDAVEQLIQQFVAQSANTELPVFRRREVLWKGCLAMLDGRIDESVQINQHAISTSADVAGSPFSFQNVAITLAIERYLRRGLGDVVDTIRSILASSPRVAPNWEAGLAFALSEIGSLDESRDVFERLGAHRFAVVPRDLNWVVTMQLLALVAITLDDENRGRILLEELRPHAQLDATHGSGYASYGPVARVVGSLSSRWGDPAEGERWFAYVLSTRRPGPWTSLTRYDRAVARSLTDPAAAMQDAERAADELESLGLSAWAERSRSLAYDIRSAGTGGPVALERDGIWTLRHPSGSATLRGGVGAGHLVRLLGAPGRGFDVFELDPAADPGLPTSTASEAAIDHAARASYLRRLEQLRSATVRTIDEDAELSFLRRELAGSRHHVSTSAEVERARVRVTKAIRRAIDDVAEQSLSLAQHLRTSITTGRTCSYDPASGVPWHVEQSR